MWHVPSVSSCSVLFLQGGLLLFFSLSSFTMSLSSGDNGSVLECVARGPGLVAEFCAGWEGWLGVLAWPSWLPTGMTLFMLLSCARDKMVSWL
jgi:hypothetical protein